MDIETIKNLIRDWFGTLSVEELVSNQRLTQVFEGLDLHLCSLEAGV